MILAASADGSYETPSLFSTKGGHSLNTAKGFYLENVEIKDSDSLWLRYKTK